MAQKLPSTQQFEPASRHTDITTKGAPGTGPHRDKASRNTTWVQPAGHSCLRSGSPLKADSRNLGPSFLLQAQLLEKEAHVCRGGKGRMVHQGQQGPGRMGLWLYPDLSSNPRSAIAVGEQWFLFGWGVLQVKDDHSSLMGLLEG